LSTDLVVTPSEGVYLKLLYRRQIEEGKKLRTSILARTFDVHSATVTEVLKKLANKGLIEYTPYYGAEFTEEGIAEAQRLLRKHRLLEVLLVRLLNYDAGKACEEASKLDYYCSEHLINTISQTYGHPSICPCNKLITRNKGHCKK
jgi:DtxR family Mn-dependent transcriptional regulator